MTALLVIALAGCGNGDPDTKPDPSAAGALGIDTVLWPADVEGAQAVFDRLPDSLAGMPVQRREPESDGAYAGVEYGPETTGIRAWVMGPEGDLQDPRSHLSVMFGMGAICVDGTYTGTAAQNEWGGSDVSREGQSRPDEGLWWFSCDFEAGESTSITGHATGWVGEDLAWLVTAPDEDTTELTVAALVEAVG